MKITVVLADDHLIVREGYKSILEKEPRIQVLDCADNGVEAIRMVQALRPDVLILDLTMPEMSGMEVIRRIRNLNPAQKVLVLSMHQDLGLVIEVLRTGAMGYLHKTCAPEELVQALRTIASGEQYFDRYTSTLVIEDYLRNDEQPGLVLSDLSRREQEVLRLISEGKITKEIAHQLHVTTKTVDFHRTKIMKKLNLNTTAQLTRYALREGLTTT